MRILFFLFIFSLYLGINGYVFYKGLVVIPSGALIKILYAVFFWLLSFSFILRMFSGDKLPYNISIILSAVAFTWFVAVIYLALMALGFDILKGIDHFFKIFPNSIKGNYETVKRVTAVLSILFVILLLVYGNYNFRNPIVTRLNLSLIKPIPNNEVKIVMISDIHLSNQINGKNLERYIKMINREDPHLVFIVGDIADMRLEPLKRCKVAEKLSGINAKYGVYAVNGNHEFYAGERSALINYLKSGGVNMLIDSIAIVEGGILIAGRDDRTNHERKPLNELLAGFERSLPLILLDHQPFNLEEAEMEGVDLQLSGHTHNGQFWPGNLIVKLIYELPYGYKKRGDTHYYVSSGIGLWGPKVRIGTKSEIVVIKLNSDKNNEINRDE